MFLSLAIAFLVIVAVLLRQTRVRPVPRLYQGRLPIILGVIGLFDFFGYTNDHHVDATDYFWVVGTLLVGAVLLGALRAFSVKVWTTNNWVVRQGTPITMVLWLISLALHFVIGGGESHTSASGLEEASLLIYLGLTIGVQNYVIHRRALPLWQELGPEVGARIQVNFGQGPNAFFTNIRGGGFRPGGFGGGPGFGAGGFGAGGFGGDPANDPTIIDAEVVDDDDDGPAGLPRPN